MCDPIDTGVCLLHGLGGCKRRERLFGPKTWGPEAPCVSKSPRVLRVRDGDGRSICVYDERNHRISGRRVNQVTERTRTTRPLPRFSGNYFLVTTSDHQGL